jgi:endo-1,3-1,4-beta-glycanase ExoK
MAHILRRSGQMKVNLTPITRILRRVANECASAWDAARPVLAREWNRVRRTALAAAVRAWRATRAGAERLKRVATMVASDVRSRATTLRARGQAVVADGRIRATALAAAVWVRIGPTVTRIDARVRRTTPTTAGVIASAATLALIVIALGVYQLHLYAIARALQPVETPIITPAAPEPDAVPPATPPSVTPAPEPQAGVAPPRGAAPELGQAFVDRFDDPDFEARWYVSDGWSNGAHMENIWRRKQVRVTDAGLELVLQKSAPGAEKPLDGAEIQSHAAYRYGYFETVMRVPEGKGVVSGFFTYTGPEGRARSNEIDVEIVGKDTRIVELTTHAGDNPPAARIRLPGDAAKAFHVYAFDWQPTYVRWYIDGELVREITGAAAARLNRPQKIMLDVWGSKKLRPWVGDLDLDGGPWTLAVSCVAYAPTHEGGSLCQAGEPRPGLSPSSSLSAAN